MGTSSAGYPTKTLDAIWEAIAESVPCVQCGYEIDEDMRHCPACGSKNVFFTEEAFVKFWTDEERVRINEQCTAKHVGEVVPEDFYIPPTTLYCSNCGIKKDEII